jgi:hypothetical protein
VSFRFLRQYREIYKVPSIEVCSVLKALQTIDDPSQKTELPGWGIFNQTFVREVILGVKKTALEVAPEKLKPCPDIDNFFKFQNMSTSRHNDFERSFPDGDYRADLRAFNDEDDNIFTYTTYERFKTGEDPFF